MMDVDPVESDIERLARLLAEAPDPPPWIRRWESLDVHGVLGDGILTRQRNVDLAVAAVNALPDLLNVLVQVSMARVALDRAATHFEDEAGHRPDRAPESRR